jgi:lysylphosphatidylglycerol synthetase-like protein (DUF2156 family)
MGADRIRRFRRNWRRASPAAKEEFRVNLLVVLAMSPFLLYTAELPIFISDTTIAYFAAFLVATLVPVTGMATKIKWREIRTLTVGVGFVGILLSAFTLLQSVIETSQHILSRDVTTMDFKFSGMIFVTAVGLTAIGLIHDRFTQRDPPTNPLRYS